MALRWRRSSPTTFRPALLWPSPPQQVFIISLLLAIFAYKKQTAWHWVAVGLLVDFCLRFYVSEAAAGPGRCSSLLATATQLAAARAPPAPHAGTPTAPTCHPTCYPLRSRAPASPLWALWPWRPRRPWTWSCPASASRPGPPPCGARVSQRARVCLPGRLLGFRCPARALHPLPQACCADPAVTQGAPRPPAHACTYPTQALPSSLPSPWAFCFRRSSWSCSSRTPGRCGRRRLGPAAALGTRLALPEMPGPCAELGGR